MQVKRVFTAYKTNPTLAGVTLPDFKKETHKASVSGYLADAETLPPKYCAMVLAELRPAAILSVASVADKAAPPSASIPMVEHQRGRLFVASSSKEDSSTSGSDSSSSSGLESDDEAIVLGNGKGSTSNGDDPASVASDEVAKV
jgi:hypothetical protein